MTRLGVVRSADDADTGFRGDRPRRHGAEIAVRGHQRIAPQPRLAMNSG